MTIQTQRGITIEAYSTGTTRIADPDNELTWAEGLTFANSYPGGDMDAAFTVKRDIVAWWALKGAQRVVFRQGQRIVYEGYVASLDRLLDEGGQAIRVPLVGAWSHIMMNRRWHRLWCDKRIDESVWKWTTGIAGAEKCTIDRNTRLRFTPKAEAWLNGEFAQVVYIMPVGETAKRITFDYNYQEAAQVWYLALYNTAASGVEWACATSATGSEDIVFTTPTTELHFYFQALANQTPASDGTYFGEVSNVSVYSVTGGVTPAIVAQDVIAKFTDLNTSTVEVDANTLSIVPFIAEWDDAASIVTRAMSFGDSSNNRWAAFIANSESVAAPDGKPLLGTEQYPALTDYDYALRLDETNIAGSVEINQDFGNIINNIIVEYADENGWPVWITPTDQATLTSAASIALYGQRDYLLSLGYSTATVATANGVRFLNAYKDPAWNASPIPIWDYIRKKSGETIPPARIRSGKRLKVENFTQDLSGTGLTMLVTGVRYDDESGVATLTFGQPASPLMTILTPPPRIIEDVPAGGGGDTGGGSDTGGGGGGGASTPPVGFGGPDKLNFYKSKEWNAAVKMGFASQADFKKLSAKQKKALKQRVRRARG